MEEKKVDYQLRARIPGETAARLFEVIKDLQEKTEVADVTTSSITRAALEAFMKDHNSNNIKIDLDNSQISTDELVKVTQKLLELMKAADSEGEKYLYNEIARKLLVEQCDRF